MADAPVTDGTPIGLRGQPPGGLDREYWQGRRVFLTGHTGFKGSWLSLWLESLGADVTGYALEPPTQPNLYDQAGVASSLRSIIADIRDYPRLAAAVAEARPEVVLHMAAQSVVKRGYEDPIETYSANVMGTVHLFEAIRRLGTGCVVVNVTSDKCYAHRASGPGYREDDPMGGDDPYSNSKGCAELVTTSFRQSFFNPDTFDQHGIALASARAGNAIGGGDWTANQLIPDLVRCFISGQPCPIRSPRAIRPWQFVLEPLRGYLMLAERLGRHGAAFASGWNFGPADDDAKPVSWIADYLTKAWGGDAAWIRDEAAHPAEAAVLRLDAAKAASELQWRPTLPLAEALDWIVEWYRGWGAGEDARRLTLDQISRYERALHSSSPASHN
jgi:CDP-glucose 4,6-dehydratase